MKIVYSLLGSLFGVLGLYVVAGYIIDFSYFKNLPESGPGSFPGLPILLNGIVLFPVISLIFFALFFIFYNKLNVRGIAFGGMAGFWIFSLLSVFSYSALYSFLPFILIIAGYVVIKRAYPDQPWNGILWGALGGLLVSYHMVIVGRALNNTLTSYFNFSDFEKLFVLIGILIFGIAGCLIGKKSSKKVEASP